MTNERKDSIFKWIVGIIAVIGIVAALYCALIWWPHYKVSGLRKLVGPLEVFNAEDRTRQTAATILGGLAVLAGAGLTLRNVRAAEKSAETARKAAEQNAEIALRNIKLAEDKLITDRFTAAVTNFSAEGEGKMAQRLGGIYALERIARDSPEYHWTVMEVLTAHIRDKHKRLKNKSTGNIPDKTPEEIQEARKLPTDIAEILRVITRRDAEQDKGRNLDIYNVDLFGAYLVKANLQRAVMGDTLLEVANLNGIDLRDAHLERANFAVACLVEADLREANLKYAIFWRTDLQDAKLGGAKLGKAQLADCLNLTQNQLDSADQEEAPESLPPGLHFPPQPSPKPPI